MSRSDPSPAGLHNHADKPQGAVPRKTQQYIILGVATLIVLIALFSGHGEAKSRAASQTPGAPDPAAPNAAEISAYQQQLQQLQQAAQGGMKPSGLAPDGTALREQQLAMQGALRTQPSDPPAPPPPDPIKQQEQTRAYDSLFASNIALSYRPNEDTGSVPLASAAPQTPAALAALDPQLQQILTAEAAPLVVPPKPNSAPASAASPASAKPQPATAPPDGSFVLAEGTILPTVLLNRLTGDFAGPVECMVSNDVYSSDRQHVLIPAGSKVLGEARQVAGFGQRRLAVVFHRLLLPNGASVSLDTAQGLDQGGATGLHDQVNNHYFQIFGVSAAVGLLGAAAEFGQSTDIATGRALFLEGVGSGMSQASMQVLDKFLNILPTITIREGHRVDIFLTSDLLLPAYRAAATSVQLGGGSQ